MNACPPGSEDGGCDGPLQSADGATLRYGFRPLGPFPTKPAPSLLLIGAVVGFELLLLVFGWMQPYW